MKLTNWLMQQVQAADPAKSWDMISLVLVDHEEMTKLNNQYFARNHPTDVISFVYDQLPGAQEEVSGEVIVNAQRALEDGDRHGGTAHELALYVAHGCDHLSGADDRTEAEQQTMRSRELSWLAHADCAPLVETLLEPPGTYTA